jgi:Amt family ammonium transporter
MKKFLTMIALAGAMFWAAPAMADDAASAASEVAAVVASAPVAAAASDAAASAPAAAPAPTAPFVVGTDKISSGDTAWMIVATGLVLFMTIPGLALFYGGMVRKKNVLSTLMQSFAITGLMTVLWVIVGYSLAFTPGNGFIGGLDRVMMDGIAFMKDAGKLSVHNLAPSIPESVFAMFQMTFAIITPALICGAFAERMKFSSMLVFMVLWFLLAYVPVAHMVWEPTGWMFAAGVLDFAGGTVVHINAGVAGLVCCLVLGKRIGYGREAMMPHNLVLTLVGASMLWVGWFGFNAGSAVAADGRAGMALLVTHVATGTAALAWMFTEWLAKGKPSVLGIASGAVAGLVAITPAAGFVGVKGALIIGLLAGVICYWSAVHLKHMLGYDDSLDAFGVHGVGGLLGALLTGILAVKDIGGVDGSLIVQAKGALFTVVYSGVVTFVILKVVDVIMGLRVPEEDERQGLDVTLHGERVE